MTGFLKVFLRGLIITILLPLILAVWVLYGAYCIVVFLLMFVKSVISFFSGDSSKGEMREDVEARRMLLEKEKAQDQAQQAMSAMYQTAMAQMQMQQAMAQAQQVPPAQTNQPSEPFGPEIYSSQEKTQEASDSEQNLEEENNDDNSY